MENDPIFHAILLAKRMARGGYADGGDTSDPIAYANSLLGYGDAASQSSLNNSGLPTSLPMGIAPSVAKPSAMQTPGTPSSVQPDISGLSAPAAGQAAPSVAAGPAAPTPSTPAPTPTPAAGKPAAKKDETTSTNTQKRGGRVGYYDGGLIDLDTPVPSTQQNIGLYGIDWGNPDSSADFFRADQQLQKALAVSNQILNGNSDVDSNTNPRLIPPEVIPNPTPNNVPLPPVRPSNLGDETTDTSTQAPPASAPQGGSTVPPPQNVNVKGVDPRLIDIYNEASKSLPEGYSVQLTSGYRAGDPRFHGQGKAVDFQITDANGNVLNNYQNLPAFRTYEQFAQSARKAQMQMYPELNDQLRWGGYFSGKTHPFGGPYGAVDIMHLDLGGDKVGMQGGSWAGGLTDAQRKLLQNKAISQGMGQGYASGGMVDHALRKAYLFGGSPQDVDPNDPSQWLNFAGQSDDVPTGVPLIQSVGTDAAVNTAKGVSDAVSLPHEVMTGEVDPYSDEGIARATNLALTIMGGGIGGVEEGGTSLGSGPIRNTKGLIKESGINLISKDPSIADIPLSSVNLEAKIAPQTAHDIEYEYSKKNDLLPWKEITPEDIYNQNGYVTPALGDKSRAGTMLHKVNDVELTEPVTQQGGGEFARSQEDPNAIWASRSSAVKGMLKKINEQKGDENSPIFMSHTVMGIPSIDSTQGMVQTMLRQIEPLKSNISNADAEKFDNFVGSKLAGWPGILNPKEAEQFMAADKTGTRAAVLVQAFDKAGPQKAGFPNVGAARLANMDPRLISAEQLASGFSIGKLSPQQALDIGTVHETYDRPFTGTYEGGFRHPIPSRLMFPDWWNAGKTVDKNGNPVTSTMRQQALMTQMPVQKADQQWLDAIMQYLEKDKRKWGYYKGGLIP